MTDKIMIDGVDVSGCEFVANCLPTADCTLLNGFCSEYPNCGYKQLQRTQNQYNAVVEQNKSLQQQLKRKENECHGLSHGQHVQNKVIKELQAELQAATSEIKYLKKCCEKAGLELAKNSFNWDGKEKNLVVQAMELNKKYEAEQQKVKELEEEYEELKNLHVDLVGIKECEIRELKQYRQALKEIKEIVKRRLLQRMPIQVKSIAEDITDILQKCEVLNV